MKTVQIKEGHITKFRRVPDDWEEGDDLPAADITDRDMTTSGAGSLALGISKERHEAIFGKKAGAEQ